MSTRLVAAYVARDGAVRRSQLLLKSNFSADDIDGAIARLVECRLARAGRGFRLRRARWQALGRQAAEASMPHIERIPSTSDWRSRICARRSKRISQSR